jgi:TPR repeat protein
MNTSEMRYAAERGDVEAQVKVADTLAKDGNWPEAANWYERAAAAGSDTAMLALAEIYDEGKGRPRDGAKALQWYKAFVPFGQRDLARGQTANPAPDEPILNKINRQIYTSLSAQVVGSTERAIARKYLIGDGIEADDAQAFFWMQSAGEHGDVPAQWLLGLMYKEGRGTQQDPLTALRWLERAAHNGSKEAQYEAATLLLGRMGVAPDLARAHRWLLASAGQQEPRAAALLGHIYLDGFNVPADPATALHFLRVAADRGDLEASEIVHRLRPNRSDFTGACNWNSCGKRLLDGEGKFPLDAGLSYTFCPEHFAVAVDALLHGEGGRIRVGTGRIYRTAFRRWLRTAPGWQRLWLVVSFLFLMLGLAVTYSTWPVTAPSEVRPTMDEYRAPFILGGLVWLVPSVILLVVGKLGAWILKGFRRGTTLPPNSA